MFRGKGEPLCRRVRGMLSEYVDSRLDSESKSLVERHLETCEACARELVSLRMTVQLLHRVPEVSAPRSFAVTVPQPKRGSAFGPASMRWLRPATAVVAIALVALLMGDFLFGFQNNGGVNYGPGNATLSGGQLVPAPANPELQIMVAVPGVMGQMALATAKSVGYSDYTVIPSPKLPLVAVQTVPSVSDNETRGPHALAGVPDNETLAGAGEMALGEGGAGWPLRQTEIGLGAAVFALLGLMIFARRQRRKKLSVG